ncbi:MAG TPA: hypothetical protein VGH97_10605 [Thermoanaerobaculia bacterium]|jgi:hypothetical protein
MTEFLRWIVGAFILGNAIWGVIQALRVARRKLAAGRVAGPRSADAVLESLTWPLVTLWISSLVLFVTSAVLVVLAKAAAIPAFLVAFLVDALVFWHAQRRAAGAAYGARASLTRCVLFGLIAVASLGGGPPPPSPHASGPEAAEHEGGRRGSFRPVV